MNYTKGSLWNKWDLHVHTPASLINHYSAGSQEETWKAYVKDLESLPPEIKVIGVNDYIFIDGYRRLLEVKSKGGLKNIELLIPVIELRLKEFGGTKNKFSRVNFHIIFSEELPPDLIEQQFINRLKTKYLVNPKYEKIAKSWSSLVTRDSLEELGNIIISSVPKDERKNFDSPLIEGFNNLNFNYEHIQDCLGNELFKDKFITAVGKTEWADIKWSDNTIAEKKNIINSVDCVFISSYSYEDFYGAQKSLAASGVNSKLLDCSDAHYYSNSKEKDCIGKCFSWIKADTSFEGLRKAIFQYDERVFTGDIPSKLEIVNLNKTKYIESISIKIKPGAKLKEHWFDAELDLNHGLVSIIGNKGGGKSALADVIGLLGNSRNEEWFSFLNKDKFRKPIDGKADHFEANLSWASGDVVLANLGQATNDTGVESVKYIPQNFFEEICNELSEIEESQFDKEIKKVIYSHVPKSDRLRLSTLDQIIDVKTRETYQSIETLKEQIQKINKEYDQLEERFTDDNHKFLQSQLKEKNKELTAFTRSKPKEVVKPTQKDAKLSEQIDNLHAEKDKLISDQKVTDEKLSEITLSISTHNRLIQMLGNLEKYIEGFAEEFNNIGDEVGFKFEKLFKYSVNKQQLEEKISQFDKEKTTAKLELSGEGDKSLSKKMKEIDKELKNLEQKLDKPQRDHQAYLKALKEWERSKKEIIGNKKALGSIEHLKNEIRELDLIPDKLKKLHARRVGHTKNIYKGITAVCETYKSLYKPVQDFIESNPDIKDKTALSFDVSIINLGFQNDLFDWVSRGATGSFYGANEGAKVAEDIVAKYDFNVPVHPINFIEDILQYLLFDQKNEKKEKISIKSQLKKGKSLVSLYDYLFSLDYLKPRYILKMGEKELSELSPGERGTLLLVFYLLVDKNDIPLVIDQPEHNLDNQTVYGVLVPAIKKAKASRQVIIVTHNPNLAVVCNSDQIIYASLNIKDNHRLKYLSGAIENPEINKIMVDVLEGTWPAFDYRNNVYIHRN